MVTVYNTTRSPLGILPGVMIEPMGRRDISADDYKAAQNSRVVQGWLNAGKLRAEEVIDYAAPAPAAPAAPAADETADDEAGGIDRAALLREAADLGIPINTRWRDDTIAKKIRERRDELGQEID